ncbi:cation/H(+) antiporter 15-like [Prunus dulcis]|uniref:cation/H(+) antiporter 15-like n=1 Tax=Prunus dulcis TaxID=3755 RepID=UPI0014833F49|nr:cation/H(+) antiporter 15-like [Prunus dulcis]
MVNNGTGGETYFLKADTKDSVQLCYVRKVSPYGLWRAQNPLMQALPVLVMRMIITMFFTHLLVLVCKPLHQPRIVPEILGGMALGVVIFLKSNIFPLSSLLTLETAGNFALVYHMFLVGLELDFKPILRAGKKSLSIALVGIVFCVLVGFGLFRYLLYRDFDYQTKAKGTKYGPFFWGIALATTNFSDLAGILADLKLLYSDIGGLALSASVISDLCSWFLLLTVMAIVNHNQILAVTSTLAFVGLCVFVVRPALSRIINRIREGARESNNIDYHGLTCYVMAGVVLCGLITDAGGSHSMVGPFIFGAIMPRGEFSNTLIEKLRTFVPVVLMPIYYSVNGVRLLWLRL